MKNDLLTYRILLQHIDLVITAFSIWSCNAMLAIPVNRLYYQQTNEILKGKFAVCTPSTAYHRFNWVARGCCDDLSPSSSTTRHMHHASSALLTHVAHSQAFVHDASASFMIVNIYGLGFLTVSHSNIIIIFIFNKKWLLWSAKNHRPAFVVVSFDSSKQAAKSRDNRPMPFNVAGLANHHLYFLYLISIASVDV